MAGASRRKLGVHAEWRGPSQAGVARSAVRPASLANPVEIDRVVRLGRTVRLALEDTTRLG